MMHWSADFIGTPYVEFGRDRTGCDCWGLAVIIYSACRGITLPHYVGDYSSVDERREISALISGATSSPVWHRVAQDDVREFDIAVFRQGRIESHVGIVIGPDTMIHMREEDCAKIERFDNGPWKGRLTGFYRHFKMVGIDV